jgi:hypothetical protein
MDRLFKLRGLDLRPDSHNNHSTIHLATTPGATMADQRDHDEPMADYRDTKDITSDDDNFENTDSEANGPRPSLMSSTSTPKSPGTPISKLASTTTRLR